MGLLTLQCGSTGSRPAPAGPLDVSIPLGSVPTSMHSVEDLKEDLHLVGSFMQSGIPTTQFFLLCVHI